MSTLEKTKKKDQKRAFRFPMGSKRIAIGSRIKLKIYTSNREREILIPSLSIAHGEPKDVRRIELVTEPAGAWT